MSRHLIVVGHLHSGLSVRWLGRCLDTIHFLGPQFRRLLRPVRNFRSSRAAALIGNALAGRHSRDAAQHSIHDRIGDGSRRLGGGDTAAGAFARIDRSLGGRLRGRGGAARLAGHVLPWYRRAVECRASESTLPADAGTKSSRRV